MRLIIFGPPGVGKGTISAMIKKEFSIPHISSGNLIREMIAGNGHFAAELKPFLDRGQLVPDAIAINIIKERVEQKDCDHGFILDGFPRTIPQAEFLDRMLGNINLNIEHVLNLIASDKVIIERLSGRRICKKCDAVYHIINLKPKKEGICDNCGSTLFQRDDDKQDIIKKRIKVYHKETQPLIAYYNDKGILVDIQTEKLIEGIFLDVKKVLEN